MSRFDFHTTPDATNMIDSTSTNGHWQITYSGHTVQPSGHLDHGKVTIHHKGEAVLSFFPHTLIRACSLNLDAERHIWDTLPSYVMFEATKISDRARAIARNS